MANTFTFEMTENQAKSVEKLLDDYIAGFTPNGESSEREKRISQSKAETRTIKKEIWEQLAILNKRIERPAAI